MTHFSFEPLELRRLFGVQVLGTLNGEPSQLTPVGSDLYYSLRTPLPGNDFAVSIQKRDAAGKTYSIRPADGTSWNPESGATLARVGQRAVVLTYFRGQPHLWSIDARANVATPLRDVVSPGEATASFHGSLYFESASGSNKLWRTDGTAAGTSAVPPLPLGAGSFPRHLTVTDGHLYYTARSSDALYGLFRIDGTSQAKLMDTVSFYELTSAGSRVYLSTSDYVRSRLMYADGNESTTHDVPGSDTIAHTVRSLTGVGTRAYFTASTAENGRELWVADGSSAGTRRLTDLAPGPSDGFAGEQLIAFGDALIFATSGNLYKIGADEQPMLLASGRIDEMIVLNDRLYFSKDDTLHVTDGTAAGTRSLGVFAQRLTAGTDGLFFGNASQILVEHPARRAVEGFIYRDVNDNGVRDEAEREFLAGFRVFADLDNDGKFSSNEPWTRSDAGGKYYIGGLRLRKYTIRLTDVDGWLAAARDVTVRDDRTSWLHFGAVHNRGAIEGFVYNDFNRNGVRDRFEGEFLSGFRVFVDLNNDGRLNSNEPWTRSSADGKYRLDDLTPGTRTVRLTPVAGWTATSPALWTVTIRRARTAPANFGQSGRATASGTVFNDLNENGVLDSGETGLAGFRVFDDVNFNGRWDAVEPFARADELGNFRLDDVHAGRIALGVSTGIEYAITTGTSEARISPANAFTHLFGLRRV